MTFFLSKLCFMKTRRHNIRSTSVKIHYMWYISVIVSVRVTAVVPRPGQGMQSATPTGSDAIHTFFEAIIVKRIWHFLDLYPSAATATDLW